MGLEIINKLRGPSTIRVTDALSITTINLSQLSANAQTENVYAAIITSVKWSLQPTTGNFIVSRQVAGNPANSVLNMWGSGDWKHDDLANGLANSATGNLQLTLVTAGTAVITVSKSANYNVQTQDL